MGPWPILHLTEHYFLYWHGVCFGLGAVIAALLILRAEAEIGLKKTSIELWMILILLSGLIGGRLGYCLIYPSAVSSLQAVWAIWEGGLLSYTAILAGLWMAVWWLRGETKSSQQTALDQLTLAVLVAWSVGRIGNFLAGDSMGVLSPVWAFSYGRVPIQLFESIGLLLIWGWLVYYKRRATDWPKGQLIWLGLQAYLGLRFLVDFWRDEGHWAGLSYSQWAALLGLLIIRLRLWWQSKK